LAGEGRTGEYVAALETLYGLEFSEPQATEPAAQPVQEHASALAASCPVNSESKSA